MKIPEGFKGAARRLDDIDLPRIGHQIGVGEDEIHAFMDVEAAGSGFDSKGRPKMLFEPHVFYRNLTGRKRQEAVRQGLAYKRWGQKRYPRDSYPRIMRAMKIDKSAALKAASWGLGQVLGENHKTLNYSTPAEMVAKFCEDEEYHLQGIIDFLVGNNLDDELRNHEWAALARGYNGPGYRKHNYHGRLAAAYRKWKRIPDTPFTIEDLRAPAPEPVPIPPPAPKDPEKSPQQAQDGDKTPSKGDGAPKGQKGGLWGAVGTTLLGGLAAWFGDNAIWLIGGLGLALAILVVWVLMKDRKND